MKAYGNITNIADKKDFLVYTVEVRKGGMTLAEAKENLKDMNSDVKSAEKKLKKWQKTKPNKNYSGKDILEEIRYAKSNLKDAQSDLVDAQKDLDRIRSEGKLAIGACEIAQEE